MNKDAVAEISQPYQVETAQKRVPEGWYKTKISDIVEDGKISSGLFKSKSSYGAGTAIIKLGDVFANDIFNPFSVQRVEASDSDIKRYSVKVGDLIIALASVKLEGVGKVLFIPTLQEKTIFDHNVALVRLKKEVSSTLMSYVFKADYIRSAVASRATQVGTTFLKSSTILDFTVLLPKSKEEQTAIANALSDTDALLSELENLIAKKQAIKTATMQQLLTGRTRLPQFAHHPDGSKKGYKQSELGEIPEDWEIKLLSELANIRSGGTPSTTVAEYWDGSVEWCTPTDITALNGRKYLTSTSRKISELGVAKSAVEILPPGTIVMTSRATIGECAIAKVPMTTNQGFKNFLCGSEAYNEFMYYLLGSLKDRFIGLCSGSTFLEISSTQVRKFNVAVPAIEEQTAISTILSDMDEEIQALEQRLNKTRQIKQGMMQELLTGKTRLLKGGKNV